MLAAAESHKATRIVLDDGARPADRVEVQTLVVGDRQCLAVDVRRSDAGVSPPGPIQVCESAIVMLENFSSPWISGTKKKAWTTSSFPPIR